MKLVLSIERECIWWRTGSLNGAGYQILTPWSEPVFSERFGYRKAIIRIFGWRLMRLDKVKD